MQNGVIIYLSRERDASFLYHSLYLLFKNFNAEHKYPIVVFHDDIQKTTISRILLMINQNFGFVPNIRFEHLTFEFPSHISKDPSAYKVPLSQFPIGYRHMCRFHSGEIYKHPSLSQYDWYMRLDSDSFILSPIKGDVFETMSQKNYEYAYMETTIKEPEFVVEGLWQSTKDFMKANSITPKSLNDKLENGEWGNDMFYTNFELAKFSLFRSEEYMKYYDWIDKTGNIYYNRWGDAPIHWLGVHMFTDNEKIWCIQDITYQHGSIVRNASCMDQNCINYLPEIFKKWASESYNTRKNNV